jgi:hypothetical protein
MDIAPSDLYTGSTFVGHFRFIGERDMASPDGKESSPALSQEAAEEMAKYGITRVPVDYFHYEGFRYTNLKDAVAQAKLQQRPD